LAVAADVEASPTDRLFLLIREEAPFRHCTPRRCPLLASSLPTITDPS
jgi:hypothetical protein